MVQSKQFPSWKEDHGSMTVNFFFWETNLAFVSHLEESIETKMYKAKFVAFNMTSFR